MLFHPHSLDWLGACCRPARVIVFLLLSFVTVCLSAKPLLPVLTADTNLVTAGYYQLSWRSAMAGASKKKLTYELQRSGEASFRSVATIYRGPDEASVISGQGNGIYFYRVRTYSPRGPGNWSAPLRVEVQHHSLPRAFGFFSAGAIVFFLTLFFIISRSRQSANQ